MPAKGATKDQDTEAEATEQVTEDGGGDTTADNGATADASGRKGKMPTYTGTKLGGDLPESVATGRAQLYNDLLQPLTEDPGEWYEVAVFRTPNGAKQAEKDLAAGKRAIPAGEWEFATRKVQDPDQPTKRWSKLFARFLG